MVGGWKGLSQPLEGGIDSGLQCAAGPVRCTGRKRLHFPGAVLQQHLPTTLALNIWPSSQKGCERLA